jgi:hypothetical protein
MANSFFALLGWAPDNIWVFGHEAFSLTICLTDRKLRFSHIFFIQLLHCQFSHFKEKLVKARFLLALSISLLLAPIGAVYADEKDDLAKKQKEAALEKWKKLEQEKTPTPVITANFLIMANQPEAKSKALADTLERYFKVATHALKSDEKDHPWNGQLAVFLVEWPEFKILMRKAAQRSPERDETSFSVFSGDEPTLGISTPSGAKGLPENQDVIQEMLTVLLQRKMGAGTPPPWVSIGFAKATAYRVANPGSKNKPSGYGPANADLKEIWGENLPAKTRYSYGAYIIDYLAYGPLSDQFSLFVAGLRPDEGTNGSSVDAALKGINLDADALAYNARLWTKPKEAPKPKDPKKPGK